MSLKHFITTLDYSADQLLGMIKRGLEFKNNSQSIPNLPNLRATFIFANSSLRTRLSFEQGTSLLGGFSSTLNAGDSWEFEYQDGQVMNQNKQEHIKDSARVISSYCNLIGLRKSGLLTRNQGSSEFDNQQACQQLSQDSEIKALAKYSTVPVINMESNMFHPCQSMADCTTMAEEFLKQENKNYQDLDLTDFKGKKVVLTWAPHPKALPLATPHSQLITPTILGAKTVLACPPGFELDKNILEKVKEINPDFEISHDQNEALKDADVVIAKSWASMKYFGKWEEEKAHRQKFADWMITPEKMKLTKNQQGIFIHCLPIRRNVVATDQVLDSPNSKIIQTAENRMWAQMGIMEQLITNN